MVTRNVEHNPNLRKRDEEAKIEFMENAPAEEHSAVELKSLLGEFSREGERLLELNDLEELKSSIKEWLLKIKKVFGETKKGADESFLKDQKRIEKEVAELEAAIKNFQEEDEKLAQTQQAANQLFRERVEDLNQEKNRARSIEQRIQSHLLEKEKEVWSGQQKLLVLCFVRK